MKVTPEFRRFADQHALAHALVETVAPQLRAALAERGNASMVVPGGRTPLTFFGQLSLVPLDWNRVFVTLTDERWVGVGDSASNERLLREHLLRNAAALARIVGLRGDIADANAGATAAWQRLSGIDRPFDVVVVGMGEDGHFASLFPDDAGSTPGLDLSQPAGCVAVHAPAEPSQRVSLNLSALLEARLLVLLATGERKWEVLHREHDPATTKHLPVHELLAQRRTPLTVYWAP